jgi:hypothetical protein
MNNIYHRKNNNIHYNYFTIFQKDASSRQWFRRSVQKIEDQKSNA